MPRLPRRDYPGALHHVMARGIERRRIFIDDVDRAGFLWRLAAILRATGTSCFALALMPNHYHLLLETGATPLSRVMLRLGTSHAMDFNRRHSRAGHLFQNRFKSRLVGDTADFLSLVRYIHLNPVRARIVATVTELADHPWTGHAALMGRRPATFLDVPSVLRHFADDTATARRELARWMRAGLTEDEIEPAFDGCGRLSARALDPAPGPEGRYGSELDRIRLQAEGWDIEGVIRVVCAHLEVDTGPLRVGRRSAPVSRAREAVAYLATGSLGEPQTAVARATGVTSQAISLAVDRFASWPAAERESFLRLLSKPPVAD